MPTHESLFLKFLEELLIALRASADAEEPYLKESSRPYAPLWMYEDIANELEARLLLEKTLRKGG